MNRWPRATRRRGPGRRDPQGTFSRQLFLGDDLDVDRLEASFDQGMLTLTIPVSEQAKPRRVQISSQSGGAQRVEAQSSGAQPAATGESSG